MMTKCSFFCVKYKIFRISECLFVNKLIFHLCARPAGHVQLALVCSSGSFHAAWFALPGDLSR